MDTPPRDATRISVDFGTSNTVAMLSIPGRDPRPLLFDGSPLLPSAVFANPDGRLVVGRDAWHAASSNPAGVEPHPKRHIDEESLLLDGQQPALEDVITAVLRHVSAEARAVTGQHVDTAVLTYPASWAAPRRGRLEAAARAAFSTVHLVPEPVAAAHHYLSRNPVPGPGYVLVYDLGAGTFDVSAVRLTPHGLELLASAGLDDAGGLDIDAAIVDHLGETLAGRDPQRWRRLTHPVGRVDERARRQLWDHVRTAKEVLSRSTTTLVHVPLFDDELPLGRERLDALARPVLERTVAATRNLSAAVGGSEPLAGIFLAGGASRMPLVRTLLHQALGKAPAAIDQPEFVVAEGALVAVPLPDADAGDGGGWPRTDPPAADRPVAGLPARHRRWIAAAAALALLVTAGLVLATRDRRPVKGAGRFPAAASAPPSDSPSPSPSAAIDPCLVGVWVSTSYSITNYIDTVPTLFTSSGGTVMTIRADGTFVHDYNSSAPRSARIERNTWQQQVTGTISGRIRTVDQTIVVSEAVAQGSSRWTLNGRDRGTDALNSDPAPVIYVCDERTHTQNTANWRIGFTRRGA